MYKSTILAVLAGAGLVASGPVPYSFVLSDITYSSEEIYSTPAHLAVADGFISFNLSNSDAAVGGIANCSATGNQLQDFFYGNINYTCSSPPGVTTNFTYSRPANAFQVNQTWTENGEDYLAVASGTVDLKCNTTFWQNPNWTEGQLYSTTNVNCDPTNALFIPEVTDDC